MNRFPVLHLFDQPINLNSRYFRAIGERHDHQRFPVTFVLVDDGFDRAEAAARLGAPVQTLGVNSRWLYPLAILRLAKIARAANAAFVHGHFFYPTIMGLGGARLAGCRFVFTRHHSDHHTRIGKRWHTRVDALCANWSDQAVAVSEETRRLMIEVEGVDARRVTTVYNGMEPLLAPTSAAVEALKRELGIAHDRVVLMIGRLHEEKGHRYLFDALPRVLKEVGPLTVVIAGDGVERSRLEADVVGRGLGSVVRFVGWRLEIPELITLSSLVVLPSLAESFGFAVLEAMSLGRPVVAAATGGLREVIEDEKNGLLVPPRDSGALAEAMIRVLRDPGLTARLGAAGRESAAVFSFERMMSGYESVYSACLRQVPRVR